MRVLVLAGFLVTFVSATHVLPKMNIRSPHFQEQPLATRSQPPPPNEIIGFRQIVCERACPSDWDVVNCTVTDFLIDECVKTAIPDHFAYIVGCEGPDAPPNFPTPEPQTSTTALTSEEESTTQPFSTSAETETPIDPTFVPTVPPPHIITTSNRNESTSAPAPETTSPPTTDNFSTTSTQTEITQTEATSSTTNESSFSHHFYGHHPTSLRDEVLLHRLSAPIPPHTIFRYVWNNSTSANTSHACSAGNQSGLVKEIVGQCFGVNTEQTSVHSGFGHDNSNWLLSDEKFLRRSNKDTNNRDQENDPVASSHALESAHQERKARNRIGEYKRYRQFYPVVDSGNLFAINFCLRRGE